MNCHYCGKPGDLRPYGPNGEMVCFPCAMTTPEREEAAKRQFSLQLNACGNAAIIGESVGPYPVEHYRGEP